VQSVTVIVRLAATLAVVALLSGCEKLMQDMYDQPKYEPLEPSPLFANNLSSRKPIPGTVAQSSGAFADASSGREGVSKHIGVQDADPVLPTESQVQQTYPRAEIPFPVTMEVLQRGQERYNIYCSPCHSRLGDGDGMVVRRGFPRPPSYHTDELRNASLGHFYDVMTYGYGLMYPYADRVPPRDRWAIAAYIRALQLSQHAQLTDLPISVRRRLPQARQ
jgi:hypothetical protein